MNASSSSDAFPDLRAKTDVNAQTFDLEGFGVDAPTQGAAEDESNSSPAPNAKRQRTSRACASCNRQKLRCDGNHPCQRCKDLDIVELCEYLPSMRGKTRRRKNENEPDPADHALRLKDGQSTAVDTPGTNQVLPHNMDANMAMWKRDASIKHTSPAVSALWGLHPPPKDPIRQQPHPQNSRGGGPSPGLRSNTSAMNTPSSSKGGKEGHLTEKLTTLPLPGDTHNPLAVLAEASASAKSPQNVKATPQSVTREDDSYYAPLERTLKDEAPHIMSFINVHEAEQLFQMYFRYLHPHLPFLDKEHSPPSAVARRNNFLFNAICCVAARAFNVVLWERLKDFAQFEMERLPKEKNIDVVQGHLLYAMWNLIRPKHFEQDMSWLRVGVAIRTALDINLHRVALVRQAQDGLPTWMLRSIIRTWLLSYIVDKTLSAQLGKSGASSAENATARYQKMLLEGDQKPSADDVWVSCLASWAQILVRAGDMFRSEAANQHLEDSAVITNQISMPSMVRVFDKQFRQWREEAENKAKEYPDSQFMIGNIRLYDHYARLVIHSHGLQRAADHQQVDLPASFAQYQNAAIRLITGFEADLESPGLLRGCPDFVFTVLTYAAVSLLKATDPVYAHLEPHRPTIFLMTRKAADILARAAMTSDHLPASQSMFLSKLIEIKSAEPEVQQQVANVQPEPIDFEAFAQLVDQDASKTLWPPMPATYDGLDLFTNMNSEAQQGSINPNDLHQNFQVPGAALGSNFWQDQDVMFSQDSFWKSILDMVPNN